MELKAEIFSTLAAAVEALREAGDIYLGHRQLHQSSTNTADKVVDCKALSAQVPLQTATKHPQSEHIEEEVREVAVKEHIAHYLPRLKEGATHREEGEVLIDGVLVEQQRSEKCHAIGNKQVKHRRGCIGSLLKCCHKLILR